MTDAVGDGGCACGAVRYAVSGGTAWCAHVHDEATRAVHSAPFVTMVGVRSDRFSILSGESGVRAWAGDDGVERCFCERCGTHVFERSRDWFHQVHVAAATFDGGPTRGPSGHLHWESRVSWAPEDDSLPRFGGAHGSTPLGHESVRTRLDDHHPAVRVAVQWDVFDVARLMRELASSEWDGAVGDDLEEHLKGALSRPRNGWILVAEHDDQVRGFVDVKVVPCTSNGRNQLFVDDLYVDQEVRRQGLGRALLSVVDYAAQLLDADYATLLVRPDNEAARAVYEACDWEVMPHVGYERDYAESASE